MSTRPTPGMDEKIHNALPKAKNPAGGAASSPGVLKAAAKGPARSGTKKPQRGPLYIILLAGLACAVVAFAVVSVAATPAVASLFQMATATHPANFAQSNLLKPTFTPTPTMTFTPTVTASPIPTETPGVVEAAIVQDTATPERAYAQPAAASYSGSKYILVDISEQQMYVYEGDALLWSFVASTGMNNATRTGLFAVQSKIPNAYGATWNIWMPNWLGIYWAGGLENGIHSLPILPSGAQLWAGWLGRPISYGCVVLDDYDSTLLYNWAEIGTPVEIQW